MIQLDIYPNKNMIFRQLQPQIENSLGKGKAIILLGGRQVGKSTLVHSIFGSRDDVLWLNGDDPDIQRIFAEMTSDRLRLFLGNKKIVVVDEAQRIKEIGLRLKLITDQMKDIQVIATGSSSLQLTSGVSESLTGRKREFELFPLSFKELVEYTDALTETRSIPHRMIFGYYPEVVTNPGEEKEILRELSSSYLYKDILQLDGIGRPEKLVLLTQALARQIGDQIAYREIGQLIGLDAKTVERYIDILEKNHIVFRLGSFSRNLRNELKFSKKIYFYDLGLRNAVINDFRAPELRDDCGALWENYFIVERLKQNHYSGRFANMWFWRTTQQKEIDLIEEKDGVITAFEAKWNTAKKASVPLSFIQSYPEASFHIVTPHNALEFLM